MTDDLVLAVRALLRGRDKAALATALPADFAGWPYASLVLVAVDHDLSILLLMSDLAEHSKAIRLDSRVSLLFEQTEGLDQPLTGARVTALGRAERIDAEGARRRFLARHPDAAAYAGFGDFHFYRVVPERLHLVAGFGRIRWLSAAEVAPPVVPGLAEAEPEVLAHMNQDHGDAIQLYASKLLGLPGGPWQMTGLDAEGLDLKCRGQVARLAFAQPLQSAGEIRARLVDLARQARAG
jgi:putative heme iron utilization protein